MIDRLRYFLGVYCAILVPLGVLFWFVIHPWARWWRRLGPTRTYLIVLPPLVVCAALLFRVRVWLLGSKAGAAKAFLIGNLGFWIEKIPLSIPGGIILLLRRDPSLHAVTREDLERVRREAEADRATG